jgi:hypothetical protein
VSSVNSKKSLKMKVIKFGQLIQNLSKINMFLCF